MRLWFPCLALMVLSACRPVAHPLIVSDLPEPPQQRIGWIPPATGASSNLVSAANTLFTEGFPDPRGCEYREIQIVVSSVWGSERLKTKTQGWVLPADAASTNRFAICWNGVIYPILTLGERANLPADPANFAPPGGLRGDRAPGEIRSVFSTNSLRSARILLLLRSGGTELALKEWEPYERRLAASLFAKSPGAAEPGYDPYLEFANEWAWALFDHALCAHMRGDVPTAMATARKLSEIRPQIEAEAARRGFRHPPHSDLAKHDTESPYLTYLEQLPLLVADLERRAREAKQISVVGAGLTNIPNSSRRIAALIEDLDMVQARQWGQPGMVNLVEDPIVGALIQEGDAAVGPLIECLENDKRLTRSVGFSRDFHRARVVIRVSSAARAALQMILRVQFQTAAEFRAYWKKNRGVDIAERWYTTLKDDRAGREQWLQAARSILQKENIVGVPGGYFSSEIPLQPGERPKFRGEKLRTKKNPSVTELLQKRANFVAAEANKLDQYQGIYAIQTGFELVSLLAEWEKPATALVPARSLMGRAISLFYDRNSFIMSSGLALARFIPRLTQTRIEGGDTNALSEYAQWLKSVTKEQMERDVVAIFEPLIKNTNDLMTVAVSDQLFNDPASPWPDFIWKGAGYHSAFESELIQLAAFRQLMMRELNNPGIIGSMEYFRPNTVSYNLKDIGGGSRGFPWPAGAAPAIGTKVEIRRCDWVAWSLSNAKRIPFYNPFAPIEGRNEAIAKAKTVLEHGN